MHEKGQSVPQDYSQAAHWYRKAADQGNAYAQTKLGFLYSLGQGVPQDYVQAHLWFNLAAAQGDEQAPKARDITAELMTPGQVAEAQRLARNWKPITSPDVIPNGIPTDRTNAHPLSPSPSENLGPSPALLRQVQEGLIALGYEAGPPDGILRPTTWAAIRAFQADVGLPVDGKIGEAILDRIKKEMAATESRRPLEVAATGTGFVVSQKGHILTAFHVVRGAGEIRIPGISSPAIILASDPDNDLALLKAFDELPKTAIFRAPSQAIRLGENVVLVGFPLQGLLSSGPTVTTGTVSALGDPRDDKRLFQITAPVQAGNSGGPVFDEGGCVIGIVLAKLNAIKVAMLTGDLPQNVNFAIDGAVVRAFLETNGVPFQTQGSRKTLSHSEVAERAQQFVVLVENWQRAVKKGSN